MGISRAIAWAVFPYLLLTIVLLIFLMLKEAHFNRIFPLFGTGMLEVAKASFGYTALFSEPFIFAMMYPFVKNHQTYTKSLIHILIISCFHYGVILPFLFVDV